MTYRAPPLIGDMSGIHLLIDPDKWERESLTTLLREIQHKGDFRTLIVGGTYIHSGRFEEVMELCESIKAAIGNFLTAGPIDAMLSPKAHFVVLPVALGAVSPRFITDHIIAAAPTIARYGLAAWRVAYLQLDGGAATSARFFTQCQPIPRDDVGIIKTLSLAARYLGLDAVYLEAGSGAIKPVLPREVEAAVDAAGLPVIVGGGIRDRKQCDELVRAGAHSIIVGSVVEEKGSVEWLL